MLSAHREEYVNPLENWVYNCRSIYRIFFLGIWVYIWWYWTTSCLHASRLSRNPDHTVPLSCPLHDYPLHQLLCHLQIVSVMIFCFQMKMLNDIRSKIYHPMISGEIYALNSIFHFETLVVCAMLNFCQYNFRIQMFVAL